MDNIKDMANYCLNCKTKPCSLKGCPMQTNIPEFINEIKNKNYENAYNIVKENNLFSYICSMICPQEVQCEGSCIRGIKSNPTHIGKLEKFVNEYAIKNNFQIKINKKISNGKKVAVVGAGPAGMECAVELLKNGFEVDIYEKENIPGGILMYGIPDFRLSKDVVCSIVNEVKQYGANFIFNQEFGKDIKLKDLKSKYDAVFLGIGATKSMVYSLSEENVDSIYDSDIFFKKI